eukprot:3733924-Prymnesium_polylepis.1
MGLVVGTQSPRVTVVVAMELAGGMQSPPVAEPGAVETATGADLQKSAKRATRAARASVAELVRAARRVPPASSRRGRSGKPSFWRAAGTP